ncbi:MAG: alanine--tRNA ligase [Candidatus Melainabacteria bacterium]|nr:alanine--tRNA ligase [Candidatus Melainabacteria bacterium]
MNSQELRRNFLKYFKDNGHAVVGSSPVVPHDDPTLLFTNAGMNQFKDVFLGKSTRDYTRATTSQKCIRVGGKHNDLENVGHTARHLTFFEMLGNFSFGDYFKKEAIAYAWEVTTKVFAFEPERVWITVFREDDEAFEMWKQIVPEKRIVRMDEADNFWAMGDTGPCGPCSELYYDRGPKYGNAASIKEDAAGTRYMEFWNLVFMQFNRDTTGKMTPLPKQSIDTGSGLERVAALKLGVDTLFGTDVLRIIIAQIENVSGKKYNPEDPLFAPAYHVIADHIRSLSFAIADGAQPSNVERGYILRKLVRRAVRYGRLLGMHEPFLAKVLPRLVETMGPDYNELVKSQGRIGELLTLEEESFLRTLKRGGNILNTVIEKAQKNPQKQITGEDAFKLKDTYGLPLEEIQLIAKDTGLQVNLESYEILEEQAKERSRSAQTVHVQEVEESLFKTFVEKNKPCDFTGYERTSGEGKVIALVLDGKFVDALNEGQQGMVILDSTPFYAEKGGQVGDTGVLQGEKGQFLVLNCNNPYSGVITHIGTVEKGALKVGDSLSAHVDAKRRQKIANNHTATHLLHWALQKVLGDHIRQAGSLVEAGRFRFDFSHHKALTKEELRQIEALVNEKVREGTDVAAYELSYEEAQRHPDIKQFFGEKYGSTVRVIDIDYSKELCGGTHTRNVGTIGYFRVTKEGSVASGVRRIEGATGKEAEEFAYQNEDISEKSAEVLKVTPSKLIERSVALVEENKQLSIELRAFKKGSLKQLAKDLAAKANKTESFAYIAEVVNVESELLPELVEELLNLLRSGVILLGTKAEGRCQLIARVSSDLCQKGVQAVQLIKEIAPLVGGSGGGKAESAQAGGKNPDGLPQAIEKAKQWLAEKK